MTCGRATQPEASCRPIAPATLPLTVIIVISVTVTVCASVSSQDRCWQEHCLEAALDGLLLQAEWQSGSLQHGSITLARMFSRL